MVEPSVTTHVRRPAPDHRDTGRAQLVLAALLCFCAGGLYGWSALVSVIETSLGGSTGQAGLVFSLAVVFFSIAVFVTPRLSSQFQGLAGCSIFGVAGAGFLLVASFADTYLLFVLTFSAGFGTASGAIYINVLTLASASQRPKLFTPVMVAAFGLGGVVFGPTWRLLVALNWGMHALTPLAVALALVSMIAWLAAGSTGLTEYTIAARPDAQSKKAVAGRTFVLLLVWLTFALGSMGGLMVLGLASKIIETAGGSVMVSTVALAGIAVGNTTGRLSVGGLSLWVNPVTIALVAATVGGIGLLLTGWAVSAMFISAGLVIVALGYGTLASAIPTLTGSVFGKDQFAIKFSIVFTAWGVAGLCAPWVAGVIFDRTGNFDDAVLAALIATFGAMMTLLILSYLLAHDPIVPHPESSR